MTSQAHRLESVDCRVRMVLRARSASAIWSIHARTVSGVRSPRRAARMLHTRGVIRQNLIPG